MARADRLERLDRRREGLEEDYREALIAALKVTAAGSWGLFDHRQDKHDRARAAPAVAELQELAETIAECRRQGKGVSVCGEMAGDVAMTRLLLGLGLRSFSMHPAQVLHVKQEVLRADAGRLEAWAGEVLEAEDPSALMG